GRSWLFNYNSSSQGRRCPAKASWSSFRPVASPSFHIHSHTHTHTHTHPPTHKETDRITEQGDQLTCPRVREGPSEEELFQREGDDCCLEQGRRRRREEEGQRWEERLQENWENCLELNLSYQDLGDPFQKENFLRILRRLIRVEKLQLVDNSLTNLSSVRLPRCRILNLHRNHLVCLRQLPKLPAVEHLCLSENAIGSLRGLGTLENSSLRSLNLTHNPVTFTQDYRAQ
uniref:U2A'/phosphoprotein 32 family A C-terminal domain-containing protein n=1 Tax=Seriola lalandi dorsalis TaxID=1841481 RepID=A0A3B4XI72_SERLL